MSQFSDEALCGLRLRECTIKLPFIVVPAIGGVLPFASFSVAGGPMDKPAQNIQDGFLNNARKEKGIITIYLLSGVKLSGRIKSFDKYSLVLETNNQEQLIFKHAISTVVTLKSHAHGHSSHSPAPAHPSPVTQPESSEE